MQKDKMSIISRTRRDILKGRITDRSHHIASVLVQGWPDRITEIERELTGLPGVESYGTNGNGKLILTLEAEDDAGLVATMNRIETAKGVVTASLVYHHAEEMDDA